MIEAMNTLLSILSIGAVWLVVAVVLSLFLGRLFSGSWIEEEWCRPDEDEEEFWHAA